MAFPDYVPTTPNLIRRSVDRFGANPFVVLDDTRFTYAEIEARSARMARGLLSDGVGKGSRIGVLMPNSPDWIVAWLAITRIGAILVPFNTFYQKRELEWILRHADVERLLTVDRFLSHDYLSRLEEALPGLAESGRGPLRLPSMPYLRAIHVFGNGSRPWARSGEELERECDPKIDAAFLAAVEEQVSAADPMIVIYSSGSTSDPKGAIHSHGSVIRHSFNLGTRRDIKASDRVWSPMPFFWIGGFVFSLLCNVHAGACMLCEEAFDPEKTLAMLERERASIAAGWPHFGKALSDHPNFARTDLSFLRGGNIPNILPAEVCSPDPALRPNALGMTETGGPHTYASEGTLPESLRGSFGTAVEGVEHRVVDPETRVPLAPGEFGEICVRGYNVMQGLHKLERESVFDADGFYPTGDGGYFDADGVLYFQGRLGDMIKTAGANVTPAEVEAVLCGFPEIKHAYVVGLRDPERGQNVAAAVVVEAGQPIDANEIQQRVKSLLSAYKVPRHVFLFADNRELPFTDTGKIDKRKLAERLEARV